MVGRWLISLVLLAMTAPAAAALDKVVVGWGITGATAPVMIALDKGYFRQLGIDPVMQEFRGSADAVSALATSNLDVDLGGVTAGFFNSVARGLDARVVAPMNIQPPAPGSTPLMARKDLWDSGAIRTARDLRGRKVAVNAPGNGVEYKLFLILQSAGMGFGDVDLTRLGFPEMLVALKNKGIDAAVLAEPFGTLAAQQNLAVFMTKESDFARGDVTTVVLFSGKLIRERRAVGVRFLQAIIGGIRDLSADGWRKPENVAIMTRYMHLSPAVLLASVFTAFDPTLDIDRGFASLEHQEAVHRTLGYLTYAKPLPRDQVIDPTLAREAVATMPTLKAE
ncbi:MAG TPA: ABC transporter substrate-binding protein [Stellaceae bacterium]|nr:ABC transporter substrate-binding protein [Stellaceae bacterium]